MWWGSWPPGAYNPDRRTLQTTKSSETPRFPQGRDLPERIADPPPLTGTIPSRPCLSSVKGYAWPQLKAIFILSNTVDPLIVFPALLSGRTFSSCLDICMGICWSPCFEGSKGIPGFVFFLFSLAILPYLFQLVARYYGEPYKIPWRMRVGIKKGLEEN